MSNNNIIVIGVSGCGKTTIGNLLAEKLNYSFYDGDDFHSDENVRKMKLGIPLNDSDRGGWLQSLNDLLNQKSKIVLACSALKSSYREMLKQNNNEIIFVYLKGTMPQIWERHRKRDGHYFNGKEMLESQFETLVEPTKEEAIIVSIEEKPNNIVDKVKNELEVHYAWQLE